MNQRHELLREAASNLPAFHDEEKQTILSTIEIEADLVKVLALFVEKSGWHANASTPRHLKCELCAMEGDETGNNPRHLPSCPVSIGMAAIAKAGAA